VQQRPDHAALLEAVAQFLISEVYPAIPDKKLNFRVLIAANLANLVCAELKGGEAQSEGELKRLHELLPGVVDGEASGASARSRAEALGALNRELASRLRHRRFDPAALARVQAHLKQTLTETLTLVNPRFDTSPTIE
jgi:hypothetical protein